MEMVYALASIQGLMLVVLLVTRKKQSQANFLMAMYVLFLAFTLAVSYYVGSGKLSTIHPVMGLNVGITFLCGPFIWLYARLLTGVDSALRKKDLLHFLPYVIFTAFAFLAFYALPLAEKETMTQNASESWALNILFWTNGIKIFHSLVYYYYSFLLIHKKEKALPDLHANGNFFALKWLRWLLVIITAVSAVMGLWFMIYLVYGKSIFDPIMGKTINLLLFVLVYAMAWFALKYPRLFGQYESDQKLKRESKYRQSSLSAAESLSIWQSLNSIMKEEKLFLNADLSMIDLTDKLGYSVKHLSQVINEQSGDNFFSFVNQFRVEEFKQVAIKEENAHLTLVAIALNCGFASKSSFYATFKKLEGLTPRQFLKLNSIQMAPQ